MDTADRMMKDILDAICPPTPAQTELRLHPALRNLAAVYRKAHRDGLSIPIDLRNAVQGVIDLLPKTANLYSERRTEPRYQEHRDGGLDMSPRGGRLEPGS